MATINRRLDDLEKRLEPPTTCAFGTMDIDDGTPGMVKVQFRDGTSLEMTQAEFERDYPGATLIRFIDLN